MGLQKVLIIAEAGVNHNGSLENAKALVDVAVEAGADVVKFQVFKTAEVIIPNTEAASYQKINTGKEQTQYEMLKDLELKDEEFIALKQYCDSKGIIFMASAFDLESIDFVDSLVTVLKIPSGEITNRPYLERVAQKNKPIILSTGMALEKEIEESLQIIEGISPGIPITILHCTTNYPTPYNEVNLKAMLTLKDRFHKEVGYSDHTSGVEVAVAAVALGASVIEKHFTLSNELSGPDHKASLEPEELKTMIRMIRNIEIALGDGIKVPQLSEAEIRGLARKSIVSADALPFGHVLDVNDLKYKRPGTGMSPNRMNELIGKRLTHSVEKDHIFVEDDVE